MENDTETLGSLVRKLEQDFISGGGALMSKYVRTDLYEDINKIYAYLNSKHISGKTDDLGREKPFFNIVIAARNIWYRSTDIDRKNILVRPTKLNQVAAAFVATVLLQDWMRRERFGSFLNDMGMEMAAFNSAVCKFIDSNGKLTPMVIPWSRIIVDQIDFKNNPKIEILELTEGQLRQRKEYDQDLVEKLCDAVQARETTGRQRQDNKNNYIKLYEVHGLFPLSYLTGKAKDEDTYVQQMHVISFVESKEQGKYDDFTLYAGRESKDPYMLVSLLPSTDGSVSLDGSVKLLFDAQWMMNHTAKSIKDQMDVASKLIFQTADANYVGRNVLSAIEQGDIMVHAENKPLTQINNTSHDISTQESYSNMWKSLSNEIAGVSESMLGNTAPSGTAWRQVEAVLNESRSLFELMTENKGLAIEDMIREYVVPHLKKKMNTSDEISAILEDHNIKKLDAMYVPRAAANLAREEAKKALLRGEVPTMDQAQAENQVRQGLAQLGNQRFFTPNDITDQTWKDALKDLEWDLDVDIVGEGTDNQMVLTTLNTALATVANPNYSNNPQAQLIVSKILMATGVVSPIEIASLPSQPAPAVPAPPVGTVSGGLPVTTTSNG